MLLDAPFLYTVLKTDREGVLFMYEHSERMQSGRPAKWLSVMLYSLQVVLLLYSAGQVFSGGNADFDAQITSYTVTVPEHKLPYSWEAQP